MKCAMTDEPSSEFPATALIDTHLKLLDVAGVDDDLLEALEDLVCMGRGADEPAVVLDSGGTRHLVWRGYVTGGLITVWLRAGGALRDAEVSAFIGDPRLEVFVPAHGDVVVSARCGTRSCCRGRNGTRRSELRTPSRISSPASSMTPWPRRRRSCRVSALTTRTTMRMPSRTPSAYPSTRSTHRVPR